MILSIEMFAPEMRSGIDEAYVDTRRRTKQQQIRFERPLGLIRDASTVSKGCHQGLRGVVRSESVVASRESKRRAL